MVFARTSGIPAFIKQARVGSFTVWKDKQRTEARSEETKSQIEGEKERGRKGKRRRERESKRRGKAAAQDREMHG